MLGLSQATAAQGEEPPLPPVTYLEATPSSFAIDSLMLKATKAGRTVVAVGERGHIVRSTDDGATWHQAAHVPTQSTLTDVHFLTSSVGWAVGHDAIILHTEDGGKNWSRQFADPGAERLLLTIHFFNENHGFAMGDGSLILETKDGGKSWKRHSAWRDTYGDFQLSDAFQSPKADTIYVAADFGAVFRFRDTGLTFRLMQTPAQATFRRGFMLENGTVWLTGARDQLWRSNRNRTDWRRIKTNAGYALNTGTALPNDSLLFAGDHGAVVMSFDGGKTFRAVTSPTLADYVDVLWIADSTVLFLGSAGLTRVQMPTAQDCPPDSEQAANCELVLLDRKLTPIN